MGGIISPVRPGTHMRTLILDRPGVLRLTETPAPDPPDEGMALVRVLRIGVCGTDFHAWHGRQPFFTYPRILGHELAVEVMAAGDNVTNVRAGDRCAVEPYIDCGKCRACRIGRNNCCERLTVLGVHVDGGMREMFQVPARKLHPSTTLSADALALVETLSIGAHAARRANPASGDRVLVLGAGPIGLGTAAFAAARGARVAVADVNAGRLEFCRTALGIDDVVDVSEGPAESILRSALDGELPPIVIDATGNAASMHSAFTMIANGGTLVLVGLILGDVTFNDPDFHRRETTLLASRNALPDDFRQVLTALEDGRVDVKPWVTHRAELGGAAHAIPEWTRTADGLVKAVIEIEEK
jgi:2-desacetyl-2-hydroxyethyl bacteriochlorophyllide A dehydrogenase